MTDTPPEAIAPAPLEPGDQESKEAAYLRDIAVLQESVARAESAAATAIADAIAAIPPIYEAEGDISYNSGYTSTTAGQLHYQVYGKLVVITGGAHRTAGDFSETATAVATIPASDANGNPIRPPVAVRFATYGTVRRIASVDIQPSGVISISVPDAPDDPNHPGDYNPALLQWASCHTSYLLD